MFDLPGKIIRKLCSKPKKRQAFRERTLRFEALENRELLSVNPLALTPADETPAYVYIDSAVDSENAAISLSISGELPDSPYAAFIESAETISNLNVTGWHTAAMLSAAEEDTECDFEPVDTGGFISESTEPLTVLECNEEEVIIGLTRSDDNEYSAACDITVDYRITRTVIYFNGGSPDTIVTEGSFMFYAGETSYEFTIGILNDAIPEASETILFELLGASNGYTVSGSTEIEVEDDDEWLITFDTGDAVSAERLSGAAQDYGFFSVIRTYAEEGKNGDTTYAVSVGFDLIYNSTAGSADTSDYLLEYRGTGGLWYTLYAYSTSTNETDTEIRYHYSVTIAAGSTATCLRLSGLFDWEDEAELFNPFGEGTPWDNDGELAVFEIISVSWTGMDSGWNPLGEELTAVIEIKDGAICNITADSNNDKSLSAADNAPSVKNNSAAPGKVIRVNDDDDNSNLIADKLDAAVIKEDDLAEAKLYIWIDELTKASGGTNSFDISLDIPTSLAVWLASTKGTEIQNGVISNGRVTPETRLATLQAGTNSYVQTVYIEAKSADSNIVTLKAEPVLNTNAAAGSDSTKVLAFVFDLDIDSDNNDFYALPARSFREEFYEDNAYGFGKLIVPNWRDPDLDGVLGCWDGYYTDTYTPTQTGVLNSIEFYPIVLEIPQYIPLDDLYIRFEYMAAILMPPGTGNALPSFNTGSIRIWTQNGLTIRNGANVSAGGDLIVPTGEDSNGYSAAQLGFTDTNRIRIFYVEGVTENAVQYADENEWKDIDKNTKPDTSIKVSLFYGENKIAEDEVRYIVSYDNPQESPTKSFWYNVLTHEELRHAFVSSAIYSRTDLPQFGMQLLGVQELIRMGLNSDIVSLLIQAFPGDFMTTLGSAIELDIAQQLAPGFNAGIYYDHITGKAVLTFQGSDPPQEDIGDWIANLGQGIGIPTYQYRNAMYIGRNLLSLFNTETSLASFAQTTPWKPTGIMITGHSLGGGLASAAALVSGFHANTFNAAGLSEITIANANFARICDGYDVVQTQNYGQLIQSYITENDILDFIQSPLGSQALGTRIILQYENWVPAIESHLMPQVFYGLMYKYHYT